MTKRSFLGGILAASLLAPLSASTAFAHVAPCPYCSMTITQDTPTQDNEVALKIGRKRIEYKCVYCALAEAKTEYEGDLSIVAPSEKKAEPVLLSRENGKWSALPATVYFVANDEIKHKVCQIQARAFTSQKAAQDYIAANKEQLPSVKPLTLDEMLKVAGG